MSFWDKLKPAEAPVAGLNAELSEDKRRLSIAWDDGRRSELPVRTLRQRCPCASCVDEWTHERTFDPASVREDLTALEVHPVGNYAVAITFSDGHRTGIFRWETLRGIG